MEYSLLQGYTISKLTLGTVALGMNYGISNFYGQPDRTTGISVLSAAKRGGINTFDTARTYGQAEQLIGDFFVDDATGQLPNVVTKFKISADNISNKQRVRAEIYESVRASARYLRLRKLPICLFHSNRQLPVDQVLKILPPLLEDLKNDGIIDVAGVSVDHPGEVPYFLENKVIEAVQVPINLFDTRVIHNGMMEKMQAEGKIVFARSVFLQGLFFMDPNKLKGNLSDAADCLRTLQAIARDANLDMAQLAFSFVSDLPGVTSIVFGAVTPEQVQQNIEFSRTNVMNNELRRLIQLNFENIPDYIITPGLWSF